VNRRTTVPTGHDERLETPLTPWTMADEVAADADNGPVSFIG
jgi:hypothetical protein